MHSLSPIVKGITEDIKCPKCQTPISIDLEIEDGNEPHDGEFTGWCPVCRGMINYTLEIQYIFTVIE